MLPFLCLPNTAHLNLKISCATQRDVLRREETVLFSYNVRLRRRSQPVDATL